MSNQPPDPVVSSHAFVRARAIFESALEHPSTERDRFIQEASGDDTALLAQVQRMLHADGAPHPLLDGGPALWEDRWSPGETFAGHFSVIALIGRGGMGEVYRAHDAILGRDVALKVLPSGVSGAADLADDRAARLRREAQVLAGLNHPNIAAIHGLEEADGVRALVLELVEGPTLADRIAAGPVPLEDTIAIAQQIATGLEAAHEKGVVHRDLKPANIKVRPDGTVKVLDFGLAKIVQPVAGPDRSTTTSPTITSASLVAQGVLLGTAAYMSPEQARGREADRRSDIWAFGAVLYELVSGERAFKGEDVSDTLAAVLRADVDWSRLPASTPVALQHLLARCLNRDHRRRLRDIGEARIALEDLTQGSSVAAVPAAPPRPSASPRWPRPAVPAVAAAIVSATVVAVALWPSAPAGPLPVTRFALSMPAAQTLLLDPQSRDLSITPDGARVIYKGGSRIDRTQLFVFALDELEPKPLTGVGMPKGPFVSPDGQWVGFFEPGTGAPGAAFRKVSLSGGPPLEVSRLDGPSRGATWGDDDTIIVASGASATGLLRISPSGGEPVVLTRPNRAQGESDHVWPELLPGSKTVLFTVTALTGGMDAAQVAVLDIASGTWRTLIRGASQAQYLPSGHLVYMARGALWAIGFDLKRLETVGTAVAVVPQIVVLATGAAEFDVAQDGTLVYVAHGGASAQPRTLVWVDRQGREQPIAAPPRPYSRIRLSPDGARIAVEIDDDGQDIWVWHLARETLTRVTTDPGLDESPVWMPDGNRLVFTSQTGGELGALFWQAADGSGVAEHLTKSTFVQRPTAVLPGADKILFSQGNGLMVLTLNGDRSSQMLVPRVPGDGVVSPEGRWLAYAGVDSGSPQVYVSSFASPEGGRTQVSTAGGSQPRWAVDGRELFYTGPDGGLMSVTVAPGATFTPGSPMRALERVYYNGLGVLSREGAYDVARDGRFLMLKQVSSPDQPDEAATVIVVKNWMEEVKRLVPVQR